MPVVSPWFVARFPFRHLHEALPHLHGERRDEDVDAGAEVLQADGTHEAPLLLFPSVAMSARGERERERESQPIKMKRSRFRRVQIKHTHIRSTYLIYIYT